MPGQAEIEVRAEIEARLKAAGEAGEVLVDEIQGAGFDGADLSDYAHFYLRLSRVGRTALNYISGPRRKRRPFKTWVWERKWRYPSGPKSV